MATLKEITAAYNKLAHEHGRKIVPRFSSKVEAEKRLARLRAEVVKFTWGAQKDNPYHFLNPAQKAKRGELFAWVLGELRAGRMPERPEGCTPQIWGGLISQAKRKLNAGSQSR
ncbi:MAG: hypothetical protein KJ622_03760 [Alphaproteobacteria bacterium]|nr:hypothetical protein [Alphaproteobacteria bacterium]